MHWNGSIGRSEATQIVKKREVVDDARDFVLASQPAAMLHPARESTGAHRLDPWRRELSVAVSRVVGIGLHQSRVHQSCKCREPVRLRRVRSEFDQIQMSVDTVASGSQQRADAEIDDVSADCFGGPGDCCLDLLAANMLAEG